MEDMTENNQKAENNQNTAASPDLADRLTHLAMMLRRMDMMGRGGRAFGGMRAGQGRVLRILTLRSPMPQRELAYMLGVRPQSLSELLGKLESAGLVERKRDETDRRTFNVEITEEGRTAESGFQEMEDPFDVLSEEERDQFGDLLDRVSDAVRAKFPDDVRGDFRGEGRGDGRGRGFGGPHPFGGEPGFGDRGGRGGHGGRGRRGGRGGYGGQRPDEDRSEWCDREVGDIPTGAEGFEEHGTDPHAEMGRMAMLRMGMTGRDFGQGFGRGSGRGFGRGARFA